MNEKDQEFGRWYAETHPTSYKGYLYFASYNIEALKGNASSGFGFIKDDVNRRKFIKTLSWKLLKFVTKDWAQYIAHKVSPNEYQSSLAGKMVFNVVKAESWLIGKLVKDIDAPHDSKRAYTALAVTTSLVPVVMIGKALDKLIKKFVQYLLLSSWKFLKR